MSISIQLSPPLATDTTNFTLRGDEFLGDLSTFVTQTNTATANILAESALASAAVGTSTTLVSQIQVDKTTIQSNLTNLSNKYLGVKTSLPTTNNSGGGLASGTFCILDSNSTYTAKLWDGYAWRDLQESYAGTYTTSLLSQTAGYRTTAQSQWLDAVNVVNELGTHWYGVLTSSPGSGSEGSLYFNSTDQQMYRYTSGSWQPLTSANAITLSGGGTIAGSLMVNGTVNITSSYTTPQISFDTSPASEPIIFGELLPNSNIADGHLWLGYVYQGPSGANITIDFAKYRTVFIYSNYTINITSITVPPAGTECVIFVKGDTGNYNWPYLGYINLPSTMKQSSGSTQLTGPSNSALKAFTFISDGTSLVLSNTVGPYTTPYIGGGY